MAEFTSKWSPADYYSRHLIDIRRLIHFYASNNDIPNWMNQIWFFLDEVRGRIGKEGQTMQEKFETIQENISKLPEGFMFIEGIAKTVSNKKEITCQLTEIQQDYNAIVKEIHTFQQKLFSLTFKHGIDLPVHRKRKTFVEDMEDD